MSDIKFNIWLLWRKIIYGNRIIFDNVKQKSQRMNRHKNYRIFEIIFDTSSGPFSLNY